MYYRLHPNLAMIWALFLVILGVMQVQADALCPAYIPPVNLDITEWREDLFGHVTAKTYLFTVSPTKATSHHPPHMSPCSGPSYISFYSHATKSCQAYCDISHPKPEPQAFGCFYSFSRKYSTTTVTLNLTCDPTATTMQLNPNVNTSVWQPTFELSGRYSGVCADEPSSLTSPALTTLPPTSTVQPTVPTPNPTKTPMWPNCDAITTPFTLPFTGGDYESIGCTFKAFVTVNAEELHHFSTGSITIASGTVLAGTDIGIGIVGPTSAMDGPLHITVRKMVFEQDAVLTFTGSLPPLSSLVIEENRFNLVHRNAHSGDGALIAGISLIAPKWDLSLIDYTRLSVNNNDFRAGNTIGSSFVGVYFQAENLFVANASTFSLSGNVVRDAVGYSVGAVRWASDCPHSCFTSLTDRSTFALNSNSVINVTAAEAFAVMHSGGRSDSSGRFIIDGHSTLSFDGNAIVGANVGKLAAISLSRADSTASVSGDSVISISGNIVDRATFTSASADAVNCGWSFTDHLNLVNSSSFNFNGNRVSNVNGTTENSAARAVYWYWNEGTTLSISRFSRISCDGNSVSSATAWSALMACWFSWGSISKATVSGSSAITHNDNIISNSTQVKQSFVSAVSWNWQTAGSRTLEVTEGGTISMSHNAIRSVSVAARYAVIGQVVYIVWTGALNELTIAERSTFALNGNIISDSGFGSVYVASWAYTKATRFILSNKSTFSVKGNLLSTNGGQSLMYLSFDTNSSFVVSSGSRLALDENTLISGKPRGLFDSYIPLSIVSGGTLSASNNTMSGLELLDVVTLFDFEFGNGQLVVEGNSIKSTEVPDGFRLVNVARLTKTRHATVLACGNNLSWDAHSSEIPTPYLRPASLAALAVSCDSHPLQSTISPIITTFAASVVCESGSALSTAIHTVESFKGQVQRTVGNADDTVTVFVSFPSEALRSTYITEVNKGTFPHVLSAVAVDSTNNGDQTNAYDASAEGRMMNNVIIMAVCVGAFALVCGTVSFIMYCYMQSKKTLKSSKGALNDLYEQPLV